MIARRQFLGAAAARAASGASTRQRPNILLILADDLGYSDLGCFGGEISTPNLDRLASSGVRFTQLYSSARCCPSRAALLTGQHPHATGMGNMVGGQAREGFAGYTGRVSERAKFLPAVLREAGYTALMCGKWHLGQPGPVARGFDEFYGMIHGFDSFWDSSKYTRLPQGRPSAKASQPVFHATDAITDHALDFLNTARQSPAKPWFLYLAYNAPHFPLHAPADLIDKYQGVYEQGWDSIREKRLAKMKSIGLARAAWSLPPRSVVGPNRVSTPNGWAPKRNPAWEAVPAERRSDLARRMAVFAAMVDQMDRNIGRVTSDLSAKGELDNTLILFCSDNGACAEWDPWGFDIRSGPENVLHTGEKLRQMGQPGTYHSYGSAWANASNTPWSLYKHYTHEGGISGPCIAHWPRGLKPRKGSTDHQPWHFVDMLPTLASVAGARPPAGVSGTDMSPMFAGRRVRRGPLFWEHEGSRAVRDGKWKIAAVHPAGKWELYDIEADRIEQNDLAAKHPGRVAKMAAQWEVWAKQNRVLPWIWSPAYPASGAP